MNKPFFIFICLAFAFLQLCSNAPGFSRQENDSGKNSIRSDSPGPGEIENLQETFAPKKIALIVAVGEYAKVGDYPHITAATRSWFSISSGNDVPLIEAALRAQGFNDILVIADQQATYEGIKSAIKTQLIDKAKLGDIMVFHYSGHGQQVKDDNGDEVDGYDEALVPYDAPIKYVESVYQGERHFRDDLLGEMMGEARAKLGPDGHLLVILDACHSGTATRGIGKARGTEIKCAPEGYKPVVASGKKEPSHLSLENNAARGEDGPLASFVLISGASAEELNYETNDETGKGVGSLSYAFSRALVKAGSANTYDALFDLIRHDMSSYAPRQTPQIEGNIQTRVLNGTAVAPPTYFKVKQFLDEKNVSIAGGKLFGLFEGTELAFYELGKDTAKSRPLATGKITGVYDLESDVLLDRPLSKVQAAGAWVYITKRNFGDMGVKVKLDINQNPEFKKMVEAELSKVKLITIVKDNPDLVIEMNNQFTASRGAEAIQVITFDNQILFSDQVQESSSAKIAREITESTIIPYAQAKFLRKIEMVNSDLRVSFEFVPVTVEQAGRTVRIKDRLDISKKMGSTGVPEFKIGDYFVFRITNHGTRDAYFCILDIQPDNKTAVLVPYGNRTPAEYKIKAGETKELPDIYKIGPPDGMENIMLISTEEPIDLTNLVASRGTRGSSSSGPLATLLGDTYKDPGMGTRGPETVSVPPAAGNIETRIFRIVK